MAEPKKPRPHTPKAVVEEIKKDLAASPDRKPGRLVAIAEKWGVTTGIIDDIMKSAANRRDVAALRAGIAERNFTLVARTQERIVEALEDDDKMKETQLKDMALAVEKLTNAGVTAMDGHAPVIGKIDFTAIQVRESRLEAYDERIRARKAELALQKATAIDAEIV